MSHSRRASIIDFESEDTPWPDTGVNIQIMQPGQPNCRYEPAEAYADWRTEPWRPMQNPWPLGG